MTTPVACVNWHARGVCSYCEFLGSDECDRGARGSEAVSTPVDRPVDNSRAGERP